MTAEPPDLLAPARRRLRVVASALLALALLAAVAAASWSDGAHRAHYGVATLALVAGAAALALASRRAPRRGAP
ncbi:MAG: hypothetical protein R3B48_22880 [Kofleriaceae bacterium]